MNKKSPGASGLLEIFAMYCLCLTGKKEFNLILNSGELQILHKNDLWFWI